MRTFVQFTRELRASGRGARDLEVKGYGYNCDKDVGNNVGLPNVVDVHTNIDSKTWTTTVIWILLTIWMTFIVMDV